jgi:transcription initiation factor TFIID subunit 2
MDLGTMQTNVSQSLYPTMESFKKDVDLIIANCHQFNPPGTYPITCADAVEAVFKKEWAHATQKKLESKEKRALLGVLNKLILDPAYVVTQSSFMLRGLTSLSWWVFWDPVDPVALGIPTYFDVIPKKNARDLKTIRFKLEADKYGSPEALEADIDLMIDNAIAFNGVESEVGQIGTKLRARVQDELARITGSVTRKRKDGGGTPMPGAKKVKLS